MKEGIVSILGCGWLGLPLGKYLLGQKLLVKGSVTSPEKFDLLRTCGILPYQIVLGESHLKVDDSSFFETDLLIISIPPRRIEDIERIFPAQIAQLIPIILKAEIRKVIFISSTSVYPDEMRTVSENDVLSPEKASGKGLVQAENLLRNQTEFQTTIIRFGGLIGADRNPARFLQRTDRAIANSPVNLIHQDDCIGIISAIMESDLWGETLNACCPEHPLKKEFYFKAAQISGLPMPQISDQSEAYKIVDSSKLERLLNYEFKYLSPLDYLNSMGSGQKQNTI